MSRFVALDAFRGVTVAAMILVNTPGSWSHVYWPLGHADWHGCTPTDLIFPFFLFIVGSAMCFSLRPAGYQASAPLVLKTLRRAAVIFLIGVLLNAFPFDEPFESLRIMGVLQRIGIAYGVAGLIVLFFSRREIVGLAVGLLLFYWYLLYTFGGAEPYSLEGNVVRAVDVMVLGAGHLWGGKGIAFDPEGLLATLPAVVSVLIGFETTRFLTGLKDYRASLSPLLTAGVAAVAVGLVWDAYWPINKSLWTGSYVVFSSGAALLFLAFFIWLIDVQGRTWVAKPFIIYGTNPLFIYALSWLWVKCYVELIRVDNGQGEVVDGYTWLYDKFLFVADPFNASLLFALVHVLLFWLIAYFLYRRNIVIKI